LTLVNACKRAAAQECKVQRARGAMDMLSDPVLIVVPFALWVGLIVVALRTLAVGDEKTGVPFRSARDILEEDVARHDIGREEYVDRRKALDYISGMV
jgi:hypothetical protein